MSYESRAYETEHGDPVVVLVAHGTHDVSRIVQALAHGNCEQFDLQGKIVRQLKRKNSGRLALALLKAHGGADFTDGDGELIGRICDAQGIPRVGVVDPKPAQEEK